MNFDATTTASSAAAGTAAPSDVLLAGGYFWTPLEVEILRQNYPVGGTKLCVPLLPGRALSAILAKASSLRLRAPAPTQPRRPERVYESTPTLDAEIRALYCSAQRRGDVKAFARRANLPAWWVGRRARELGVRRSNRTKAGAWSKEALQLLQTHAACDAKTIAKKLRRAGFEHTETAVVCMLKRTKFDRTNPNVWTTEQLATLCGVQPDSVCRWVNGYGLKPMAGRKSPRGGFVFHRREVKGWISKHPSFLDLRRVDQLWFTDLVFGPVEP